MKNRFKDLVEKEEQYKLILENSNDLIAIFNNNFQYEFINENAYLNVLGYIREEVIGKHPRDFLHPEDIPQISKLLKRG